MAKILTRKDEPLSASEERDIRVEDYLNDKLQTVSDLANIDALLDGVKAQQALLRKQVSLLALASRYFSY